jgi:ATP-binding cassette, subfamily B (MDR/TAP), member 1
LNLGFYYGSVLVHEGSITPGKVITIFWTVMMAVESFQGILPQILVVAKAQAAAAALCNVLNTVSSGTRFTRQMGLMSPEFCEGDIEVRDVSFDADFSFATSHAN